MLKLLSKKMLLQVIRDSCIVSGSSNVQNSSIAGIAGGVGAGALCMVILGIFLYRRRRGLSPSIQVSCS